MPQEKIIIKFVAKDANKLINAIDRLTAAQKNLQKGIVTTTSKTGGATVANKKLAQSQHLVSQRMSGNAKTANALQGAFATLRNKLLLLSFAMAMAVKPILDLIKAQSDAEEIANKFNVVFGRQADVVREWAGTFGQSVGRASSELQGMLATLQDTFVPLGFARKEATKLSISLTTLALDVASFNNKLDADVIRDFQSALVGNHETVRKYGIVITEAQLAAEALRSGIIETKRELTSQEKVQARLNLIIAGSKDAIGDLDRTQESYANTLKRFNAEVRVTQEELGKALIPLATELLGVMTNLAIHFRDTDAIRNYTLFLGGVAISMSGITAATFSLAGALVFLRTAMIRTGVGALAVGLGYLAERLFFADDATEEFNDAIDANAFKAKRAEDRIADLAQEIDTYVISLVDANEAVITQEEKLKQWIGTMNLANSTINSFASISARLAKTSIENASLTFMGTAANKDYVAMETLKVKQSEEMRVAEQKLLIVKKQHNLASDAEKISLAFTISELNNKISTYKKLHPMEVDNLVITQRLTGAAKDKAEADKEAAKALKELTKAMEDNIEMSEMVAFGWEAFAKSIERPIELGDIATTTLEDMGVATNALAIQLYNLTGLTDSTAQGMLDIANSTMGTMTSINQMGADTLQNQRQEAINHAKATIHNERALKAKLTSINDNFDAKEKKRRKDLKPWMMGAALAQGALSVLNVWAEVNPRKGFWQRLAESIAVGAAAAVQINQISAANFEHGGMIGGRRHSQGGTMINAEAGEFVMSRSAVQSVGIESLNRMNEGSGGGASLTFNISGNLMSSDYVEGELADQIKEAIRRGTDFGIS